MGKNSAAPGTHGRVSVGADSLSASFEIVQLDAAGGGGGVDRISELGTT